MGWAGRFFGSGTPNSNVTKKFSLDEDTFSMMILSNPFKSSSCCKGCVCFSFTPEWVLGISVFFIQCILGLMIAYDQLHGDGLYVLGAFNVPVSVTFSVAFGQLFTILLAIMTQTDILVAIKTFHYLRHTKDNSWEEMIDDGKINRSTTTWLVRVFIPLFLKLTEGGLILFITWLLIVQSTNIVDLLKDFTALFVISSIDDLFFVFAENGYLGQDVYARSQDVKDTELRSIVEKDTNETSTSVMYKSEKSWIVLVVLGAIFLTYFGGWSYFAVQQANGSYLEDALGDDFDNCKSSLDDNISIWFSGMGDGTCNENYNTEACDYDLGDCS